MDFTNLTSLISTIGFPIVMCVILMRYIQTTQKELIAKMGEISANIAALCTIVKGGDGNDGR